MTRNADWNLNSTPWTFRLQCGIKKVEKGGGVAAPLNSKTMGGCVRSLEAGKHTKG
jgi:hypothetical protein